MREEEPQLQVTQDSDRVLSLVGPSAGAKAFLAGWIVNAELRQILLTNVDASQQELHFVVAVAGLACLGGR